MIVRHHQSCFDFDFSSTHMLLWQQHKNPALKMSINYSFAGKKILITGGASGIGRHMVQRFHDGGAIVYTVDKNEEKLQKLKKELPNVKAEMVNLGDWNATKAVIEKFGAVDHLVNNAGFFIVEKLLDVSEASASSVLDTVVKGALNVTQVVAKGMIDAGIKGTIVNISSMSSRLALPMCAIYSSSKAAVEALTRSMAFELGPHDIRVNCVAPGMVNTPIIQQANGEISPAHLEILKKRAIIKRPIEPNEIADVVLYLLSPLSSMVVGETVVCDGGFTLT